MKPFDFIFSVIPRRARADQSAGAALSRIAGPAAFALLWLVSSGFTNVEPHLFSREQCTGCHDGVPAEGAGVQMKFVAPVNELCESCHGRMDTVSHKLCVMPNFSVRSSMPLETGCGVTCATCHDPHLPPIDPATGKKTHYLRRDETGMWHCDVCHRSEMSSRSDLQTHRPSMDTAHGYSHYTVIVGGGTLDRLSLKCLSCHDAPDRPEQTLPGSGAWRHGSNTFIPHRVGIDYEKAAWDRPDLKLKTRDESLPLFDGKVGCCTCHDPYRPGGGMQLRLGSSEDVEPLCRGCHLDR